MLSLLSDENFNGDIVRGLFMHQPKLDLLRVQDVGLQEVDDPAILDWAASNERILLTHDRATMPDFAYERLVRQQMTGLFVIKQIVPVKCIRLFSLIYENSWNQMVEMVSLLLKFIRPCPILQEFV